MDLKKIPTQDLAEELVVRFQGFQNHWENANKARREKLGPLVQTFSVLFVQMKNFFEELTERNELVDA